jgi:hypothetical protein
MSGAFDLDYARTMSAHQPAVATALATRALIEVAHAGLCARGAWVLNEKHLLPEAGLDDAAALVATAGTGPDALDRALDHIDTLLL